MLRKSLRWIVRVVVTLLVLVVIAVISDYLSHRIANGSVLVVTFSGPVVERGTPGILGALATQETPLDSMRAALDRAGKDPRIVGLAVKLLDTEMELSQAQEIAAMIQKFRSHGKWAAAYVESAGEFSPGNLPYMVAAATGDISLMPEGEIDMVGVSIREIFARGTLDWLGVKPDFAAFGQYKTAANIFTEKDFTAPQHFEDDALVGGMFDQIVGQIATERGITSNQVKGFVDQAPIMAQAALKDHLVERLEYEDQFSERMKHRGGGVIHGMVNFTDYARPTLAAGFGGGDQIAVIYCDGEIVRGPSGGIGISGGTTVGSDSLDEAFKTVRQDDSVRAVIFRIDSPGGSVIGSELIRRAVELTAKRKPVVINMSSYAASGGYWVATPGDWIIAEPGSITGSIGVLGGKFNVAPAAQNIHLNTGAVSRGANVEMFDSFTDFTPDQTKIFQDQLLGNTYQRFLKIVADSRHMTVSQVDAIAQGRVWTGEQASHIKLVDQLGGFDEALFAAKKMARIPQDQPVRLEQLPEEPGLIERVLGTGAGAIAPKMPTAMRTLTPAVMIIRSALSHNGVFGSAYCPVVPIL